MSIKEKREKLTKMSGQELIDAYNYYHCNFNPIDYELCDNYELVKNEIKRRLLGNYVDVKGEGK